MEPEQPLTGMARAYAYDVLKRIATSRNERRRPRREVPLAEHDHAHEADSLDRLSAREALAAIQPTPTLREQSSDTPPSVNTNHTLLSDSFTMRVNPTVDGRPRTAPLG